MGNEHKEPCRFCLYWYRKAKKSGTCLKTTVTLYNIGLKKLVKRAIQTQEDDHCDKYKKQEGLY